MTLNSDEAASPSVKYAGPAVELSHIVVEVPDGRGSRTLLTDVNLDVMAGEAVVIYGPSGSGKTSLLKVIGGDLAPTQGEVRVQQSRPGGDSKGTRGQSLMAHVDQDSDLVGLLTGAENVMLSAQLERSRLPRAVARRQAAEAMERLGVTHLQHVWPSDMSGGERQRVALARAFNSSAGVILADEPTGALDDDNSRLIADLIIELCDQGRTFVVATHDATLRRLGRCFTLKDGRLQESLD